MSSANGVTKQAAIFDRRHVIQAIVDHTGRRFNANQVNVQADRWLETEGVLPLDGTYGWRAELVGERGKVLLDPGVQWYTTEHMVELEQYLLGAYDHGHDTNTGTVRTETVDAASDQWETDRVRGKTLAGPGAAGGGELSLPGGDVSASTS